MKATPAIGTLPRLCACVLALLWLGVNPVASQQKGGIVTIHHEGVSRPAFCDRQSFVFLSTIQGPLLRPHTVDVTRSDPIDLVLVRGRFDSGRREEVRVPGLKPEANSDLELHCHRRVIVIDEIFISLRSRGVALDWPAGAKQAALLSHFINIPTARPATLLTTLTPGSRRQLYLAGASRPVQETDLERLKRIDRETGSEFGVIVAMPEALTYLPGSLVGTRSDAGKTRIGLNVHGGSVSSVALFTGPTNAPAAVSGVPLEIAEAPTRPTRATAATLSSSTHVTFSYEQREEGRIREIAGLAECDVGVRAGHPIVTCTPIFRLALQWTKFNDMWANRKIVAAVDESGRHAVMADSTGQPTDQTCIRFIDLPAPSGLSEASATCDAVVLGQALDIAALSADSAALVIAFPGDPMRTDGIFRAVTVSRRRP
jgi:hypothetical protein